MQSSVSCPQSNSELDNNEIRSENLILEMKLGPLRKLTDNIFQNVFDMFAFILSSSLYR